MNRIIQILIKNHVFLLFIILAFISLRLLISNSFLVESKLSTQLHELSSLIFLKEKELKEYFYLKKNNKELLQNNEILLAQNRLLEKKISLLKEINLSTKMQQDHIICQGKIVKSTWNKQHNFMIINRGEKDSITSNMGVIYNNCLIGITNNVSKNFTKIISVINTNLMISAKLKNSGYYGTLNWDGKDSYVVQLNDIPKNAIINIGDTIVTSGYSNIFPENIKIGEIINYHAEANTNFLNISIQLFVDFTNIQFAYIIKNPLQTERSLIEKK